MDVMFDWVTLRRVDVIARLRQLRMQIEEKAGTLTEEEGSFLMAVCRALGLNENEAAVVMGGAFLLCRDGSGRVARRESQR